MKIVWSCCMAAVGLAGVAGVPAATRSEPDSAAAAGDNAAGVYQSIIDRNPFDLKPPPEPVAVTNPPPGPKVDIYLTGINSFVHPTRAYLMAKPAKGDPEYYSLAEQEGKDGLEVLKIDQVSRAVRILDRGEERLLTFDKNGLPSPTTVPNPVLPANAKPGGPALPGAGFVMRGPNTANYYAAPTYSGSTLPVIPSRPMRTAMAEVPGYGNVVNGVWQGPGNSVAQTPGNSVAAGGTTFSGDVIRNATAGPPPPTPSPEEQIIDMEMQRASHPNIPFPPTPGLDNGGPNGPGPNFRGGPPLPPVPGR